MDSYYQTAFGMMRSERAKKALLATIYHKLGIDHTKEYVNPLGRPTKLAADGAAPLASLG
jgi:DNA-binding CsgD family transcriptional regulator